MEAPNKVYLHPTAKGEVGKNWLTFPLTNEDVEYTRTDAFVERACNYWYKHNQEMVKRYGSNAILGCSEFTVNVKDFKKYMEGKL